MGKPTGFKEYKRVEGTYRSVKERLNDYNDILIPSPSSKTSPSPFLSK